MWSLRAHFRPPMRRDVAQGGGSSENYGANPKLSDLPRALQEWTHIPRSGQIVTRRSARVPGSQGSQAGLSWPPYVWLFICLFLAHFEVIFTLRALKKKAANVANHTTCLFFFNKSMLGWTENKCKFCVVSGFGGFCTPPLFSPIWLDLVLMENIFSGFPSVLWLPCLDYCWFKKLCPDEHMSLLYVSNNVDLSGLRQGLRQLILLFLAEYVIHCSDE